MIWHMYDNNDKAMDRIIIKEEQPHLHYIHQQQQQQPQQRHVQYHHVLKQEQKLYTSSLSSAEDVHMQTDDDEEECYSAGEESDTTTATTTTTKAKKASRMPNQSLFLNFTSDLSPHQPNKNKKKKATLNSSQASYKVNGINILNRKNLDSKTVIERIQKRRENHNHVERRRRDCINNTILELSQIVPNASLPGQKLNKGNVLKLALDYILYVQSENASIKNQLNQLLEESRESVQKSNLLIGNTSSYQGYENRPMFRSGSHHIASSSPNIPHNDHLQQQPVMREASAPPPAPSLPINTTNLLRPISPAINSSDKSVTGVIVTPSQQTLPTPLAAGAMQQYQPQQQQHYSNNPSRYATNNHYPAPFIYSESYYKNTCRFL